MQLLKPLLPLLLASLLFAGCSEVGAMKLNIAKAGVEAAGCPSWGTYWFAWDGDYPADTDKACESSGAATIDGTNSGGTFGTDGGSTIWTADVTTDYLTWTSTVGDPADATGITIWAQVRSDLPTSANEYPFQWRSDGWEDSGFMTLDMDSDNCYAHADYYGNSTNDNLLWKAIITCDGSTWEDIAHSWKVSEAGNDHAVNLNGTWYEDDDDIVTWIGADEQISFGNPNWSGDGTDYDIKYFAVLPGYKTAVPW